VVQWYSGPYQTVLCGALTNAGQSALATYGSETFIKDDGNATCNAI
jgi:hypothetical protein